MKTEKLTQATAFALSIPQVQNFITRLESLPNRFVIAQIDTQVVSYEKGVVRVLLNFNELGNPNNYREDAIIDVQATRDGFKVIRIQSVEMLP